MSFVRGLPDKDRGSPFFIGFGLLAPSHPLNGEFKGFGFSAKTMNLKPKKPVIGLFQTKTIAGTNIKTFSSLEKRPNVDYRTDFNEENVNKLKAYPNHASRVQAYQPYPPVALQCPVNLRITFHQGQFSDWTLITK